MNVFYTVDTEFHPLDGNWSEQNLIDDIRRDIDGVTPEGEFGVFFQAGLLREHGLKGVFFIEALSSYAAGIGSLERVVERIQSGGHEVGLHLHPEWLRRAPWASVLPGKQGGMMRLFSEDDQATLIAKGLEQLQRSGVETVHAFRAGGYAANLDTLRALARNGVRFDSSHNLCWSGVTCDIPTEEPLVQPREICGVYEFPVAYFQDWPGHYRHVELCACSSREIESALLDAWRAGWHSFVIVSHSFEMIKGRAETSRAPWFPDKIMIRRFQRLCEFLRANSDKFQTATFSGLDAAAIPRRSYRALSGFYPNTVWRLGEQIYRRIS